MRSILIKSQCHRSLEQILYSLHPVCSTESCHQSRIWWEWEEGKQRTRKLRSIHQCGWNLKNNSPTYLKRLWDAVLTHKAASTMPLLVFARSLFTKFPAYSQSSRSQNCKDSKVVDQFHSFTCTCPVFPAPLIEEAVFSPLYILATFIKNKVTICPWVYLWVCYPVPLLYISVFVPVPICSWLL